MHNTKQKSQGKRKRNMLNVQYYSSFSILSLIMPFKLVKPLRLPQQLAWIALPCNCCQLLGVNIFRVSRCGIKFSSTCWGKRHVSTISQVLVEEWGGDCKQGTRCQNLISNHCSCSSYTSAAAIDGLRCLSCHCAKHSQCFTDYWLFECHMNLGYFWSWDVCCQKSLSINGRWHNSVRLVVSEVC